MLQKELDTFRVSVWNNHRMRKQKAKELPDGVPEHIYMYPQNYGGEKCGLSVTKNNSRKQQNSQVCWKGQETIWKLGSETSVEDTSQTQMMLSPHRQRMLTYF